VVGLERDVFAGAELAALDGEVAGSAATGGADVQVAAGVDVGAAGGAAALLAVAFVFAGAGADTETDGVERAVGLLQGVVGVGGGQCGAAGG